MNKLKLSRIFLQIIWNPAVGDRVLFKKLGKVRFAKIQDINVMGEIQLAGHPEWWKSKHLTYVPRNQAYQKILNQLNDLFVFEWLESDPSRPDHFKCAIKGPITTIQIEGTSQDVLTRLLDLRGICPKVNQAINHLVNKSRGASHGAIQLKVVQ